MVRAKSTEFAPVPQTSGEPRTRRVAILGATGLVGRTILALLAERGFPLTSLCLLASERAVARTLRFQDQNLPVAAVGPDAFRDVNLALFATANALRYVPGEKSC